MKKGTISLTIFVSMAIYSPYSFATIDNLAQRVFYVHAQDDVWKSQDYRPLTSMQSDIEYVEAWYESGLLHEAILVRAHQRYTQRVRYKFTPAGEAFSVHSSVEVHGWMVESDLVREGDGYRAYRPQYSEGGRKVSAPEANTYYVRYLADAPRFDNTRALPFAATLTEGQDRPNATQR